MISSDPRHTPPMVLTSPIRLRILTQRAARGKRSAAPPKTASTLANERRSPCHYNGADVSARVKEDDYV